uniref:ORF18 protein n=1 Tax=Rhizobium rhizogenes TaxID=359 RepID=Q9WWF1_RHIRH|nr:ORF18 [Rhizobium rhizogenes]
MADQIHEQCWTEESLSAFGIYITPELVADALKDYWHLFAEGRLGHNKVFVPLDREGCTEGALVGFVGDYSGVKSIHSNPSNARYKEPTSHIDVVFAIVSQVDVSSLLMGWLYRRGELVGWH